MTSPSVTLLDLSARVEDFVRERDWQQFHSPKNLSMAIAVEAAELMECFQWEPGIVGQPPDGALTRAATDELADVLIYCLAMANALDIEDLATAVLDKLARSELKYPAARFKGRFK